MLLQALWAELPKELQQAPSATNKSLRKVFAPTLNTHVLLAACHSDELALESPNKDPATGELLFPPFTGLFTSMLLESLRKCDLTTTSYSGLMRDVIEKTRAVKVKDGDKIAFPTPQCEGQRNKDRLLFCTAFAPSKGMLVLMRTDGNPQGRYYIEAGSASGITVGTEFGVYEASTKPTSPPVMRLVAACVTSAGAYLNPPPEADPFVEVPSDAYVVVTKYNDHSKGVRILITDESKMPDSWHEVSENLRSQSIPIVWTKPGELSDLALVPTETGLKLQRVDPLFEPLKLADTSLGAVSVGKLTRILTAVVRFHFHLQRRNLVKPLQAELGMKLIELKPAPGSLVGWGVPNYIPIEGEKDLFGQSLSAGTIVQLETNADKRYGLILTNQSGKDLFAYVLYFDLEDYSINMLYSPPADSMKAPLIAGGRLPVGYGSSGIDPLRVETTGTIQQESGYFMLFVSDNRLDVSHIEQLSPLGGEEDTGGRGDQEQADLIKDTGVWDTIVVGVALIR